MSEHTPGPWTMGDESVTKIDGYMVKRFAIAGGGQAIASVWNGTTRAIVPGNGEANARLIAAAPELLAALKGFVESWGDAVDNDDDINGGDAVEFIGGFLQDCRAAIAKAEGAP